MLTSFRIISFLSTVIDRCRLQNVHCAVEFYNGGFAQFESENVQLDYLLDLLPSYMQYVCFINII